MSGWRWVERVQKVEKVKRGLVDRDGQNCVDGQRMQRGYGWVRKYGWQIGLMFLLACVFRCGRGGYWRHLYIIWYRGRDGRESIGGIFWKLGVVLCFADYKTTRPRDNKTTRQQVATALLFAQQKDFSRFSQFTNYFRDIMSCERTKPP